MKSFARLALSAYFILSAALMCNAEVSLLGTAASVSAAESDQVEEETVVEETSVTSVEDEEAAEEAKTDNAETTNKSIASFLSKLNAMATEIEKDNATENVWYWSNSNNEDTFEAQKASDYKVTNDALFCCWALVKCKVFDKGDRFYFSDGKLIGNGGDAESEIKKHFNVIDVDGTADELVKAGKIITGDICGYDYDHTNVYAGSNQWYDPSPKSCDVRSSDGKDYFVKILTEKGVGDDHKVKCILRFKNANTSSETTTTQTVASTENTTTAASSSASTVSSDSYKKDKQSFLAALEKMSQQCASDYNDGKTWVYSNSSCSSTFKGAVKKKNRRTNCAKFVNWGLSEIGVLDGESFWATNSGTIHWSSSCKKKVKKYCKIITVKKKMGTLIKDGTLQAGDICCYNFQHTNVYAGNNSWYDGGKRSDSTYKKNGKHYFKKFYSTKASLNWKVNYIIRLNE